MPLLWGGGGWGGHAGLGTICWAREEGWRHASNLDNRPVTARPERHVDLPWGPSDDLGTYLDTCPRLVALLSYVSGAVFQTPNENKKERERRELLCRHE